MSQTNPIGGTNPPQYSPDELRRYREDYQQGLDLFQKAFDAHREPQLEFHKKQQLEKVMSEALQVMNETASVVLKKEKLEKAKALSERYTQFLKDPSSQNEQKVFEGIQDLK